MNQESPEPELAPLLDIYPWVYVLGGGLVTLFLLVGVLRAGLVSSATATAVFVGAIFGWLFLRDIRIRRGHDVPVDIRGHLIGVAVLAVFLYGGVFWVTGEWTTFIHIALIVGFAAWSYVWYGRFLDALPSV